MKDISEVENMIVSKEFNNAEKMFRDVEKIQMMINRCLKNVFKILNKKK